MTIELKKMEKLRLIDLLSRGGTVLLKDFLPSRIDVHIAALVSHGLVSVRKTNAPRKPQELKITADGWSYLNDNLNFPDKSGSPSVAIIFSRLLELLSSQLKASGVTVDRLFAKPDEAFTPDSLYKHLLRLQRESKHLFTPAGFLPFSKLLPTLKGIAPESFRELLFELQKSGKIFLYRFDDPGMITKADKTAEILVAGEPKHYLIITT
jgi:hypothetical protein